jgi:DOPA 4,5-dioxygenase
MPAVRASLKSCKGDSALGNHFLPAATMSTPNEPARVIESWHAHVYFDAASRDAAWALRETIATEIGASVTLGRFHERPVGPHPMWSYQLAIGPAQFSTVIGWLALNHGQLDVLVHPNTGDPLRDHRDSAIWIGRSYALDLRAVGG